MRASPSSHYSSFKKKRAFVHIRYTEKGGVAIYWWQLVIMAHLLFCPTYSFGSCCSIGGRNNGPSTMFVTSPTSPMKDWSIYSFIEKQQQRKTIWTFDGAVERVSETPFIRTPQHPATTIISHLSNSPFLICSSSIISFISNSFKLLPCAGATNPLSKS